MGMIANAAAFGTLKFDLVDLRHIFRNSINIGNSLSERHPDVKETVSEQNVRMACHPKLHTTHSPSSFAKASHFAPVGASWDKSEGILLSINKIILMERRMEPTVGLEPTTYGLQNRCSTN